MPFSLTPRWVFQHYSEITLDWSAAAGDHPALLSDLDLPLLAARRPVGRISPCGTGSPPSAMRGSVS